MTDEHPFYDHPFYQQPSEDQIAAQQALVVDALGAWDLGVIGEVELLAERENAVFAVTTDRGRHVARVHRAGYHSDRQLESQIEWMRALAESGAVRTAESIDTAAGEPFTVASHDLVPEPRQVSVLAWVDGTPLSDQIEAAGASEITNWYRQLGELVAGLHEHGRSWERPADFECFSWGADGLLGDSAEWGHFWDLDQLEPDDRAVMAAFRQQAREELARIGRSDTNFGLMHNDFLAENLLVDDGRLTLLDFDDCGEGWFVFDLSPALVAVSTRDDYPDVRAAFFEGYQSRGDMSDEMVAQVPLFFALRMATYAAWLDTRRHTQFARDLGPVIIAASVDVIRQYLDGTLEV